MVTPGGQMPADLNFVAYPAIALAILSNFNRFLCPMIPKRIGNLKEIKHDRTDNANCCS
jgi:PTS system mannose-specific IIC component